MKEITTSKELNELVSSGKLVVVDFYATWCSPCLAFKPIFESVASEMKDAIFVTCNVDQARDLATEENISAIPCTKFYKSNKPTQTQAGLMTAEVFRSKIKSAI